MPPRPDGGRLPEVEQLVLLAALRLGDGAYAVTVRDEVKARAGVDLSRATVYITLDRLERKRFVESWFGDPTPERGGKAKRCFRVAPSGVRALRASLSALARLAAGTRVAPQRR